MCGPVLFLLFVTLATKSVRATTDYTPGFYQNVSYVVNYSWRELDKVRITINDKNYLMSNLVRKLTYCDMSIKDQYIPVLYKNSFYGLVSEHLQIETNLSDIKPDAFNNSVLNRLTLRNNHLEEVRGHFFFNASVSTLDLSLNNIKHIEEGAFKEIARRDQQDPFKDEICTDSDMNLLDDWVTNSYYRRGFKSDSSINLQGNKLEKVAAGVFNDLSVSLLILSNNQIGVLEPNSFNGRDFLRTILLLNNKLRSINKDVFECEDLVNLEIRNNSIGSIEPGSFGKLPQIQYIDLGLNKLKEIKKGVFNLSLKVLALDGNEISSIERGAFQGLTVEKLHLNNNTLRHISKGVFHNFIVTSLFLGSNSISRIEPQAFADLPQLTTLCLKDNKLTKIQKNMFQNVPNLQRIDLTGNDIIYINQAVSEGLPVFINTSMSQ